MVSGFVVGLTLVGLPALLLASGFAAGFEIVFDTVFVFESAFAELEAFFAFEFLAGVLVATIRMTSREQLSFR